MTAFEGLCARVPADVRSPPRHIEHILAGVKRNTSESPNLRAHVERFIQTLQVECLDKFVIVAERHLNYINWQWQLHYNRERPHEGCGNLPPECGKAPQAVRSIRHGDVVCTTRLGGTLTAYSRRAA